jgi:hypothetical protein
MVKHEALTFDLSFRDDSQAIAAFGDLLRFCGGWILVIGRFNSWWPRTGMMAAVISQRRSLTAIRRGMSD